MTAISKKAVLLLTFVIVSTTNIGQVAYSTPQTSNFTYKNRDWYDSWGYTRNNAEGSNGYMPNLAYEVLGKWQGIAFEWGTQFIEKYPDKILRAEAILRFVQQRTVYGYDEDNVIMGGKYQIEWAWNGDETASRIDFTSNIAAIGDCEDLAFICSAIYEGAGFDTAMVMTTDHAALLIWLPEYPDVIQWDLEDDGRDYGWIWVESTGENNPLGWTPNDYRDGYWDSYIVERLYIQNVQFFPSEPSVEDTVTVTASVLHRTSNIGKMTLRYYLDDNRYEVNMERVDPAKYQASIPKQESGSTIDFEIIATDENGNLKQSDLFSYRVGKGGFELPDFSVNTILIIVVIVIILLIFSKL